MIRFTVNRCQILSVKCYVKNICIIFYCFPGIILGSAHNVHGLVCSRVLITCRCSHTAPTNTDNFPMLDNICLTSSPKILLKPVGAHRPDVGVCRGLWTSTLLITKQSCVNYRYDDLSQKPYSCNVNISSKVDVESTNLVMSL